MKTAISVPDATYERAAKKAADLGLSRSAFFARAAERYLEELDAQAEVDAINAALELIGEDDSSAWAVEASRRFLLRDLDDEQW